MMIAGVVVTFLGFLISVMSLGMTSSVNGRLILVLLGSPSAWSALSECSTALS